MYRFDFEIADLVWQVEMQMGRDSSRSFGLSGCFFLLFLKKKKNLLCTFFLRAMVGVYTFGLF